MANIDASNPKYSNELRVLEKTDPAHPDTFNPLFQQLLKNDETLKHIPDDNGSGATYQLGVENGMLYIKQD